MAELQSIDDAIKLNVCVFNWGQKIEFDGEVTARAVTVKGFVVGDNCIELIEAFKRTQNAKI